MGNQKQSWLIPQRIKVYEALGALADQRLQLLGANQATCRSSSGNKLYQLSFNLQQAAIMSNDNAAYYTHSLSYPMLALFFKLDVLTYPQEYLEYFRGIKWKDLNQKYHNNYEQVCVEIATIVEARGGNWQQIEQFAQTVLAEVAQKRYQPFGKQLKPPTGY